MSRTFGRAVDRWAGIGPYYAMFPVSFADRVVARYTRPGDVLLDPFAGRGTAVFSAATQGRHGIGIEISPVGWVYGRTKLGPAGRELVERRISELGRHTCRYRARARELPLFFRHCYSPHVREFLLAARAELDWRRCTIDRTVMALILVYLHGKSGQALSNQMRQTKAMSPRYAIRWWRERKLRAPDLDPVEFLRTRLDWRYAKGAPSFSGCSHMYLGDSTRVLGRLVGLGKKATLLLTSPPYYGVTNYHYDQWLRLWILGEAANANRKPGRHRAKFESRRAYEALLTSVFSRCAEMLARHATVYVRTGRERVTELTTRRALKTVFPKAQIRRQVRPFVRPTQTHLFGDKTQKMGEVDLVLIT